MTEVTSNLREFRYVNPRSIIYSGRYSKISEQLVVGEEIKSVQIDDDFIYPGRVFNVKGNAFKCNKIFVEEFNPLYKNFKLSLYYAILNRTSGYLLPYMFDTTTASLGKKCLLFDTHFVNSYISIDDCGLDYSIYLLYRYDGSANMMALEEWFKSLDFYKETIQPDKYHTIYQFEVTDREAYDTFVESKFGKFSKEHKFKIENFFQLKHTENKYKIIHNSEELRKILEDQLGTTIPPNASLNERIKLEQETYYTTDMCVVYEFPREEI